VRAPSNRAPDKRRPDLYAGISLRATRRLAASGWTAGLIIACLLMIPAPPTAQLGAWGWVAGAGVQAASAAGLIALRRWPERFSFDVLRAVTWLLAIDLGIMQWLGGGWGAPYHELLLPALVLGSAGLPPRRFVPFAVGVAAIALLPAIYAPDRTELLGMIAELSVWGFVTGSLSVLMARIRGQARLARADPLTGLANRRAFNEQFEKHGAESVVLAIGDLDRFKQVNDGHGHMAGDACLTDVAAVLTRHARAGDRVFRWGGDEFAIFLSGTTAADAEHMLDRLEAAVAREVRDPAGEPVGITFGWAVGGPDADMATLTHAADSMLLDRKRARSPRMREAA
jgi:diguanylate cyclase (GGDEF)-like protein